jgi:RNA polymerase sigma-70 factor (ECF subfamily)
VKRDHSQATDETVLTSPEVWGRRLKRGEPAAVHQVRKRVCKIIAFQKLRIPPQDREDLEQEVMTEVWRAVNRDSFDFTAGFWGFVEIVTSRRCIDWLRKKKEHVPLVEGLRDEKESPLDRIFSGERQTIASSVFQALDPQCREIFVMRFQNGLRYRDISDHLGKSEGAVRVQMHRCVQRAREVLESVDCVKRQDRRGKCSDESS